MKIIPLRITLVAGLLALFGSLAVPAVLAADRKAPTAKTKKISKKDLKKYDKNGNGKLEPSEKAALKRDAAKAKKKKKKTTKKRAKRKRKS